MPISAEETLALALVTLFFALVSSRLAIVILSSMPGVVAGWLLRSSRFCCAWICAVLAEYSWLLASCLVDLAWDRLCSDWSSDALASRRAVSTSSLEIV